MSRRKHLSKYARLRADLEYECARRSTEVREAWWKAREHFDQRTAAVMAENAYLMKLICDYAATRLPPPVVFLDKDRHFFEEDSP